MKYYLTPAGQLVEHHPELGQFRHRNRVGPGLGLLAPAEVNVPAWRELKRSRYSQLMNEFFRTVEDSWAYRAERFRKLPNFDQAARPAHPLHTEAQLLLVYHWGQLYYFRYSYGGFAVGQLFDYKTGAFARWAKPRHCAPVLNATRNAIL